MNVRVASNWSDYASYLDQLELQVAATASANGANARR